MANISISLNLKNYKGFKYLVEKDNAGNKIYYAAIPVTQLFNPSGTKDVYATAVMIPTPGSEYSDFMLKPMLSARELQSLSPEQFRALPILGKGKYLEQKVSKDLMKDAVKSAVVDEADTEAIFAQSAAQNPATAAPAPIMPPPTPVLNTTDTPNTLYYICDNNQVIATSKTWADASQLFKAQISPTCLLYKYEGNQVLSTYTKADFANLGL